VSPRGPASGRRVTLTLFVMLGGMDGGPLERTMRRALEASAYDTAEAALSSGRYAHVCLLTDRPPLAPPPAGLEVETDAEAGHSPFQFGRRLVEAAARRRLEAVAYVGAGSGPLLDAAGFVEIAAALGGAGEGGRCVTNNRFSADLFAVTPASLLSRLDPSPAADNAIPWRLREEQGVPVVELPRTLETQFNIDTPNDLLALRLSRRARPHLAPVLEECGFESARMEAAAMRFVDRHAEVFVAGRVSSRTWQYLETEAASRIRVLAEERGMQASGKDADGTARSMLGQLLVEAGARRFFGELLPELGQAAFIDIRPALVHLGIRPSRADRFAADLGLAAEVEDPRLREIVEAANASPVPVVLGGHSLVGGVLMLLNQWAWDVHDGLLPAGSAGRGA
jgi:hypothetical protein